MSINTSLIECVPNFSEGRDLRKIEEICKAVTDIQGAKLLHRDIGYDANRTVLTIAGHPEAVLEAAFQAIKRATSILDLRTQRGAHPRIGATDVCPLVALSGVSETEIIMRSETLAARVAKELNIPIYLYELSSQAAHRKRLEQIRKGQFEKFAEKISLPDWSPDFGPSKVHPSAGALVIGARQLLVAYNMSLNTQDASIAKRIASEIRSSGYIETINGKRIKKEGFFQNLKALGWYMDGYNCAQVSTNITDYRTTNMAEVYEKVKSLAAKYNVNVIGSELIGLVPLDTLLDASKFYTSDNLGEVSLVDLAIKNLGLGAVRDFSVEEKILEYALRNNGLVR